MLARLIAVALSSVAAACACSSGPAIATGPAAAAPYDAAAAGGPEGTDAMPTTSPTFTAGPDLSAPAPLLAWLEEQGRADPRPIVRVPVVITFANPGRFSVGVAYVGVAPGPAPDGAIKLRLDGSGLSVALVDQIRGKCADEALTCALWLDGVWGARMDGDPMGIAATAGDRHVFGVVEVGDAVDAAAATTAFVAR